MFAKTIILFGLSMSLGTAALAQTSNSPSGDPTGSSKGIAADTDPVGKPVGNEPAMVDPNSAGSTELDARSKMNCAQKPGAEKTVKETQRTTESACK